MKKWEKALVIVCTVVLTTLIGCASFQDVVTPCSIDKDTAEYAGESPTSLLPWPTLWDAERIKEKMDYVHQMNQIVLDREIEDDNLKYAYLNKVHGVHMTDAQELQGNLFNPESPLGMLLPAGMGLTLGGILIPRSKDRKEINELKNGKKS